MDIYESTCTREPTILEVKGKGNKRSWRRSYRVHRLIAAAFLGPSGMDVNHRDGNKQNNQLNNLEYVTESENLRHAYRTGLVKHARGEEHPQAKLTEASARMVRKLLQVGMTQREIAGAFKVSQSLVSEIKLNKIWKEAA